MQAWIKFIPREQLVEGEVYFIGRHRNPGDPYHEGCTFLGRGLNGKTMWTEKPGIAIKAVCDDAFRAVLDEDPAYKAVAIPADADKRWKARKPSRWSL